MLVVISDLHLTDGTSGATISPGAFAIFAERLQDLAIGASHRADGSYQPVDRVDVLLLGDVLDVIRSTRWLTGAVRPWSDPHGSEMTERVAEITTAILDHNAPAMSVFQHLAEHGLLVPPANRQGRCAWEAEEQPLPVRIFYMVGNHDWMFHLPGARYDQLRGQLARRMGLANLATQPFPHEPAEDDALFDALRRHRVCARHGDVFDPLNFLGDRDASSLGDVVVVELLNRFAEAVRSKLADELPPATIAGLRELDNVRPLLMVPVWIEGLLERTCPYPSQRKRVKQVWDELVDAFLQVPFVREQDSWRPGEGVDRLQMLLRFSKSVSLRFASRAIDWLNRVQDVREESYAAMALAEPTVRSRQARHVVYGHTHFVESVPLDASVADGFSLEQTYFNSGTWRRVHRQTRLAPQEHEFLAHDVMTYLAFFQGDERSGRPYETWSGALGLARSLSTDGVIAPRQAPQRAAEPAPVPAATTLRGPHFALPSGAEAGAPTEARSGASVVAPSASLSSRDAGPNLRVVHPAGAPAGIVPTRRG